MGADLTTLAFLLVILLLLAALGVWQQKLSALQRAEALGELQVAREIGTDRHARVVPHVDPGACIGCGSCVTACPEDGVLALVDGVARVVHASHCRGHAVCAEVCPVSALTLSAGDLPPDPDLPVVDQRLSTSVEGVHAAGELTGASLIRSSVMQGLLAAEEIARDLLAEGRVDEDPEDDLLIVGAGPAGIAAALKAVELGLRCRILDQEGVGGAVRHYPRRKLTLVGELAMPGGVQMDRPEYRKEELVELWEGWLEQHGIEVIAPARLTGLRREAERLVATSTVGRHPARRILLAVGARGTPRKLGIPGEEREKVLYRLIDAASYVHQRLLVVGGGDSAIEAALALAAQPGNRVHLVHRGAGFHRVRSRNRRALEGMVPGLEVLVRSQLVSVDAHQVRVRVESDDEVHEREIPNDTVFVFAGGTPPRDLLRELGVRLQGDAGEQPLEPAPEPEPAEI